MGRKRVFRWGANVPPLYNYILLILSSYSSIFSILLNLKEIKKQKSSLVEDR